MTEKNLVLAGLGPHARRIYYPLIEKYAEEFGIKLRLVIDLEDQADKINAYLSGRPFQPEQLLFLHERYRDGRPINCRLLTTLERIRKQYPLDGIIISTEPKAHQSYLRWAIENSVPVLMDKPITAPINPSTSTAAAQEIFNDYLSLESTLHLSNGSLFIQCQRRRHVGYQFIHRYLAGFIRQFQVPISYIDIYHADGMWPMPDELFNRENHPYKYGYGKLLHSGYHFIDLFAWLVCLNKQLEQKQPQSMDLFVKRFDAYDFLHQVNVADYGRFFNGECSRWQPAFEQEQLQTSRRFGELDVFMLGQLKRRDAVITTATINLQQNSFCRRSWSHTPEDVYKGNGRVRHERVNIQVGNLLNIQVHSYQSYEAHKQDVYTTGPGHEDHFDVHIFRNSGIVGGRPLEKYTVGEISRQQHENDDNYLGHNENARELNFIRFLKGQGSHQEFASHRFTNQLLAKTYQCMVREHQGQIPFLSFDI